MKSLGSMQQLIIGNIAARVLQLFKSLYERDSEVLERYLIHNEPIHEARCNIQRAL